jgi:hypothetical protein
VIVKPGGALDIEGSTVSGGIDGSPGAGVIRVCDSSISGTVEVKSSSGLVLVGDPADRCAPNAIVGALDVKSDMNGVEVIGNTVGGAILTSGNSGPGPFAGEPTTISGNHHPTAGSPSVPAIQNGSAAPPHAPQRGQLAPPRIPGYDAPSSASRAPAVAAPAHAAPTVAGTGHRVVTARLTPAQKLAFARNACAKLKKTRRQGCLATATER